MEEDTEEILLPAENQRFVAARHYGLLLFFTASIILTFVTLVALVKQ